MIIIAVFLPAHPSDADLLWAAPSLPYESFLSLSKFESFLRLFPSSLFGCDLLGVFWVFFMGHSFFCLNLIMFKHIWVLSENLFWQPLWLWSAEYRLSLLCESSLRMVLIVILHGHLWVFYRIFLLVYSSLVKRIFFVSNSLPDEVWSSLSIFESSLRTFPDSWVSLECYLLW